MPKLLQIKPQQLLNILLQKGFYITRQRGSHVRLKNDNGNYVTLAIHNKPVSKGTLLSILRQAGLSKGDIL